MAEGRASRTPRARVREDWAPRFLGALLDTGMVTEACAKAGVPRQTAYDRRGRDEGFACAWDEVVERSTEELEQVAYARARDGSDNLLTFLLKARRPDVYREYRQVQHVGASGGRVEVELRLDAKGRKALADVLRERPATRPE